jgi:hypothetical protein
MSISTKLHSKAVIRRTVHLLVVGALLTGSTYGHAAQNQTDKAGGTVDKNNVSDAIDKARQDNPESIYYVEQIAQARAVQAVPMLEEKFVRTQDQLDKAHIASALVRLGDKNDIYWDFLVKLATQAVESDAPDFMSYDSQGKSVPGPSPEFAAWLKTHDVPPGSAWEDSFYKLPGKVLLLALTRDPRAVPLLRKALSSPNHMIEMAAAMGLAEMGDQDSIPYIIEACKRAPAEAAAVIAESLVYFDDPAAQSAVDQFIPKDNAKIYRDAKAHGKKSPFSN